MRFNTVEEALTFIESLRENEAIKSVNITILHDEPESNVVTEGVVNITSFSDNPSVTARLDESISDNILYVDAYESVPLSCTTGKVTVLGRTVIAGVCEVVEGSPTIHLNVSLGEDTYSGVPFLMKTRDQDSDYIMVLNPKTLSQDE